MRNWSIFLVPLAMALLTFGTSAQSWAQPEEVEIEDNLNDNNLAVDESTVIEDNLNGPIGNDVQDADAAANEESIAVNDTLNDNTTYIGNDKQSAEQAANDESIAVGDIDVDVEDVANDKSENYNDTQNADVAANDGSLAMKDASMDNSINTDNSINVSEIAVAVSASVLGGAVSGNSIDLAMGMAGIQTGSNMIADDGGSLNVTGISAVSMNSGVMSQTQQNINVQASVAP